MAAAPAMTRTLRGLLHRVSPTDQWTFVSVAIAMVMLAIGASLAPARQAWRISPAEALQSE